MNSLGSKRAISDKLYNLLDDEVCDMSEICSMDYLAQHFCSVLSDYVLVPKNAIIEN